MVVSLVTRILRSLPVMGGVPYPTLGGPVAPAATDDADRNTSSGRRSPLLTVLIVAALSIAFVQFNDGGSGSQDGEGAYPVHEEKQQPVPKPEPVPKPKPRPPKRTKPLTPSSLVSSSAFRARLNDYVGQGLQLAAYAVADNLRATAGEAVKAGHDVRVFRNRKGHYCVVIIGFDSRRAATRYKRRHKLRATEVDLADYPVLVLNKPKRRGHQAPGDPI